MLLLALAGPGRAEDALDPLVADFMRDHHLPGAVVGVFVPGQPDRVLARGKADLAAGEPLRADHRFGIASVTKSFVGTVALQLVDEGRLSLEDPVDRWLPGVPAGITVRQLLEMTSGLVCYSNDPALLEVLAKEPERKWAPDELVATALAEPPLFPPGQGWHYSNTNTVLLGMLLERLTGRDLEDEVQDRILTPLGLRSTSFPREGSLGPRDAHGYEWDGDSLEETPEVDPSFLWASGAMVSDLADLRVWAGALATGQLVSPRMQRERLRFHEVRIAGTPAFYEAMDPGYGAALEKYDDSRPFHGHSGKSYGYNTQMYYLPSEKAVLITLTNTDTVMGDGPLFFATVARSVFPGTFPKLP